METRSLEDQIKDLKAKIQSLEQLLKAADELLALSRCGVPSPSRYLTASEKYRTLKQQSTSQPEGNTVNK